MVTRSRGTRKSQFPARTIVTPGATFDFVSEGTNIKITQENLQKSLGATGTITTDGDPLGTPVLDKQGSINIIRNIEPGDGIQTSVSPQNGVVVKSGIIQDQTGQTLFDDVAQTNPTAASLIPGSGMEISKMGDVITITATGILPATRRVTVNVVSDLPTASGGIITLADDTLYEFGNNLTLTDKLVLGNNCVIMGLANIVITLTYTGTGTFITIPTVGQVLDMSIVCATAEFLSVASGGGFILQNVQVLSSDTLGTITATTGFGIFTCLFISTTGGFDFIGANAASVMSNSTVIQTAGVFCDLGVSTLANFTWENMAVTLNGTSNFISGLIDSGNIVAGGLATVLNCRFSGAGTPLVNITSDDALWQFALNDDIADTRPDGMLSFNTPTTTVIATVNIPVLITGTWTTETLTQFSATAAGRLTYIGGKPAKLPITITASTESTTGNNIDITIYVAINGSVVANSGSPNALVGTDAKSTAVEWQHNFLPNDFVEVFIENNTDDKNIDVNKAILRVN